MLSNKTFYYELIRKYGVVFSNLFNNIILIRRNRDTNAEIERYKVPLQFGPKELWMRRIREDPNLSREIAQTLPRMSYTLTGFNYDAGFKQNSLMKFASANNSTSFTSQYIGTPYELNFTLSIIARNLDDGYQIIEQIIPYFSPDYTVTVNLIPEIGILKDIPITLTGIQEDIEFEGVEQDAVRYINYDLSFSMKVHFYGPISRTGIIRTAITNIYNDPSLVSGYISTLNVSNGNNGDYQLDDYVYQGSSLTTATAVARVIKWDKANAKLFLGGAQGQFATNANVYAVSTNAVYNLSTFDVNPTKLATITITPDPADATANSAYGYNTDITEYPETL